MIFKRFATDGKNNLRREAESLAAMIPALLAEARDTAQMMRSGEHGRRRSGPGDAFWQFRRYQPGDEASKIDWRQSAKASQLYVREREWSTTSLVHLWPDLSSSMRWRSDRHVPQKAHRALVLAASLGFLLVEAGETVHFLGSALPPATDAAGIGRFLEEAAAGDPNILMPEAPKRRGHVVLISDFLFEEKELDRTFGAIADGGHQGHLVHLLDPEEMNWTYQGRVRLSGLKGENDIVIAQAEGVQDAYQERMAAFQSGVEDSARRKGWSFGAALTDQPPLQALIRLHGVIGGF